MNYPLETKYYLLRPQNNLTDLFIVAVVVIRFWFQALLAGYLVNRRLLRLLKTEM